MIVDHCINELSKWGTGKLNEVHHQHTQHREDDAYYETEDWYVALHKGTNRPLIY